MVDTPSPAETAWKIHDAVQDWTGKVDVKASFALTIESALLAVILTLSTGQHRLTHLPGGSEALYIAGLVLVIAGALAAVWAVTPHLRARNLGNEWQSNFVFFGHLKDWPPEQLEAALAERDVLPMLSRQLVTMGKIAWVKHRLLQASLAAAVVGSVLLGLAAVLK